MKFFVYLLLESTCSNKLWSSFYITRKTTQYRVLSSSLIFFFCVFLFRLLHPFILHIISAFFCFQHFVCLFISLFFYSNCCPWEFFVPSTGWKLLNGTMMLSTLSKMSIQSRRTFFVSKILCIFHPYFFFFIIIINYFFFTPLLGVPLQSLQFFFFLIFHSTTLYMNIK